jgi:multisubunit Na+/H+ antiporter MnhB subunit
MLSLLALVFLVLFAIHLALHLSSRPGAATLVLPAWAIAVVLAVLVLHRHGLPG